MNHDSYPDDLIRDILASVGTIAMVGASANESRPAYFVLKFLLSRGCRMIAVNPGLAGKEILQGNRRRNSLVLARDLDSAEGLGNSSRWMGWTGFGTAFRGLRTPAAETRDGMIFKNCC